jgi:hypothetical protein
MRLDPHAKYRELLAARLDRPLTRPESRLLSGHLKGCTECQQAERDYRDQRALLRGLSQPLPPRDMWARTSTALDRELGRYPHRYPRLGRRLLGLGPVDGRRSSGAPSAITTVVTALAVVTVLAVMQLAPLRPAPLPVPVTGENDPTNAPSALRATPFAVEPQSFAVLGGSATDFSVYKTEINQVCPADSLDCFDESGITKHDVKLPGKFRPQNVALSPNGEQLAVVGTEADHDVIAVVMLVGTGGSVNPNQPLPTQRRATAPPPTETPQAPTDEPSPPDATDSPDPSTTPASQPTESTEPADTETPPTDPPTSGVPETPPPTNDGQPTDVPPSDVPPSDPPPTPAATPTFSQPGSTPIVPPRTTPPTPNRESPPPSAVPGLTVLSILEDVHSAGAPPAWSRNGSVLAFSAMPADGSHGPDVYVWEPGDERARAITNDHTSFFASWSGGRRVVISRLGDSDGKEPTVRTETVVADLETGEERLVNGPQMWLPSVDNQRNRAIVWRGEITRNGLLPELRVGALYLADWSALDPFEATAVPGGGVADVMTALEPDRDATAQPVRDWHARWSSDGLVFGVWEADAPGSSWGGLTLSTIDSEGNLAEEPLFDLNLAKRGFTLGSDRVAWIAPTDDEGEGELRIRTWGVDGEGGLRIGESIEGELVPAF